MLDCSLELLTRRGCLQGVMQASLEEVFVKVVMQFEEKVHGQSSRNAFANPLSQEALAAAEESDDED